MGIVGEMERIECESKEEYTGVREGRGTTEEREGAREGRGS